MLFNARSSIAILFMAPLAQAFGAAPPQAGIGVVWGNKDESAILRYPYVRFGQGFWLWKDIEPREGEYDWRGLDETLKRYHDLGKKVPLQINMPCPEWIFDHVASLGTSRGGRAPQYWDPVYFEILSRFVRAYADHVGASPHRDAVLFVRMQFNALNTEILSLDSSYLQGTATADRSKWTLPPNGHVYAPDLTREIEVEMVQKITQLYLDSFLPHGIPVALRMDGENDLTKSDSGVDGQAIYDRWTADPLAWSMTTHYGISLAASVESERFKRRCRERGTTGFAEQFARISPGPAQHGAEDVERKMRQAWLPDAQTGQIQLRSISPEQSFYFTMLMLLDWGFHYISVYGVDHVWARENADLTGAMEFVNKYAGWARDPAHAPGAWAALGLFHGRPRGPNLQPSNTNWGFFLTQKDAEKTSRPVFFAGDGSAPQSVWARRIAAPAEFELEPAFAASVTGQAYLRIIWLDEPGVAFRAAANGKTLALFESQGTGRWRDDWAAIPRGAFAASANPALLLAPAHGQPVVHLIEISRERSQTPPNSVY
ncbi:MAG: hypothetical protein BWZ10_00134 [candidate division BRC1 bacterium ADurb.BinA364]|nr:MAG: hypothetical protein BWZ10_00134 [candidate division BRC1 bacterium ADurb.BinA364]